MIVSKIARHTAMIDCAYLSSKVYTKYKEEEINKIVLHGYL
jgi:hypothetical protein